MQSRISYEPRVVAFKTSTTAGDTGARQATLSAGRPQQSRCALRADDRRRGSVGFCAATLEPGLQISYLNSRPQRVQLQIAKSACFSVGAGSKS
jgi:hypothetical protein